MNPNPRRAQDQEPFRDGGTEPCQPELSNAKGLWAAFAIVLAALIGTPVYGYYSSRKNHIQLSQISSLKDPVNALGRRLGDLRVRVARAQQARELAAGRLRPDERSAPRGTERARGAERGRGSDEETGRGAGNVRGARHAVQARLEPR